MSNAFPPPQPPYGSMPNYPGTPYPGVPYPGTPHQGTPYPVPPYQGPPYQGPPCQRPPCQGPGAPQQSPSRQPFPPKRGGNPLLQLILGGGGLLLVMFAGGIGWFTVVNQSSSTSEKARVSATLTDFFDEMVHKDYNAAYNHLSTTAHSQQPRAQFDALASGAFGQVFEGYESPRITDIDVFFDRPVLPGAVATTTASASGTLRYNNGRTGTFNAVLEKQGERWRIFGVKADATPWTNPPVP